MSRIVDRISLPFRIILAGICFVIGLIGIVLPVIQAWFFLGLAIYFLFPDKSRDIKEKIKSRYQNFKKRMDDKETLSS